MEELSVEPAMGDALLGLVSEGCFWEGCRVAWRLLHGLWNQRNSRVGNALGLVPTSVFDAVDRSSTTSFKGSPQLGWQEMPTDSPTRSSNTPIALHTRQLHCLSIVFAIPASNRRPETAQT